MTAPFCVLCLYLDKYTKKHCSVIVMKYKLEKRLFKRDMPNEQRNTASNLALCTIFV